MKIDVHVHLAGVGTQGSGCWISPTFRRRPTFLLLQLWYGVGSEQLRSSVDQDWVELVADRVRDSELDRAVVLGFDGVYDSAGRLDLSRSQMIVPPGWVFEACGRRPGELLPGPSVNPNRADAMERLEECVERGAVLIKWLPAVHEIDPSSSRLRSFYARLREANLPLLVHSGGGEVTFRERRAGFKDLALLHLPLEEGVTVICAHSAAPIIYSREPDQTGLLRELLARFPNLWVDNSGMANPSRFTHLARFARDADIEERTLFGTDFPVPSSPLYYLPRLGPKRTWSLQRIRNPLQRDLELKRALGYSEASLRRAATVLPSLERWT